MRSQTTKVVGLAALAALGLACDSNARPDARIPQPPIDAGGPPPPDTGVPDAAEPDAGPPPPTFSGSVSLQEVEVVGHPELGRGLQISISFTSSASALAPVYDDPGPTGCTVWRYTAATQLADPVLNEGDVTIETGDNTPVIPPCVHNAAANAYICPGAMGTADSISATGTPGVFALTDADVILSGEEGRYISISGATSPTNNGTFPIVQIAGANTVAYSNPLGVAEPTTTATYVTLAGAGPIPTAPADGFLDNTDTVTVSLTAGGDNDFPSFTDTAVTSGAGDSFTLDAASQARITNIPTDGSQFSIGCEDADANQQCDTPAGSQALGSILVITTTDSAVAPSPAPDYLMPAPTSERVVIRCSQIGQTSVTVPANVSQYIADANTTRIQTTFLRTNFTLGDETVPSPTLVAGHGVVGFTTPATP